MPFDQAPDALHDGLLVWVASFVAVEQVEQRAAVHGGDKL
jgi:hypothetical protein